MLIHVLCDSGVCFFISQIKILLVRPVYNGRDAKFAKLAKLINFLKILIGLLLLLDHAEPPPYKSLWISCYYKNNNNILKRV